MGKSRLHAFQEEVQHCGMLTQLIAHPQVRPKLDHCALQASMNREKFPEKVPFRLTRMMTKAMEVSGIEGNFRSVQ